MDAGLAFFQAQNLVLGDGVREPVDAIFFHSRSHGDDDGLFELVADYLARGQARYVAINSSDGERMGGTIPGEAWPGRIVYMNQFADHGISLYTYTIERIKPSYNSKEENEHFLDLAILRQWKTAIVLTQAHQLLRHTLGMIRSLNDRKYWMQVYAVCPRPVDWWKMVRGSQGAERKERFKHIEDEYVRISQYQEKGDLGSWDELATYFRKRDGEVIA